MVKKLLGENEVEAALKKLDRLTHDETRTTAAQTLEVVYSLVQNMRLVMDGEYTYWHVCYWLLITFPSKMERHQLPISRRRLVCLVCTIN